MTCRDVVFLSALLAVLVPVIAVSIRFPMTPDRDEVSDDDRVD